MKLRIKYIAAPLLGLMVLATSCNKSYLDKKPYNAAPLNEAIKSEGDLLVGLAGTYASLRSTNLYGRTLPVKGDLMGDNTFITTSNSGRYISMNNYVFTSADADATGIWTSGYVSIKYANTVITSGGSLTATANINQYIGEAYAIRALMLFELVRNFAKPYTVDPNAAGVPIVTAYNIDAKPARPTVKDDYTQIIADLEKAYSLITTYRGTGYFSKYAARLLEARVYQFMGDWANAKATATDVITNSGWSLMSAATYVSPSGTLGTSGNATPRPSYSPGGLWANPSPQTSTKNETMFEVLSDLLLNNGFDQIGFIYLQVGGGYGDVLATPELYNLYSATDVRRGLIPSVAAPYRSGQAGQTYLCYKYSNPDGSGDRDDTKVIRYVDAYLILAEANYNLGDIVNANLNLNKVATQRDPAFTGYANAGAQVLEDILTERRKEFAFEGYRFYDLTRLNRSWTKVKNQSPLVTVAVTPATAGNLLPIPQTELDANKSMTQNPGY